MGHENGVYVSNAANGYHARLMSVMLYCPSSITIWIYSLLGGFQAFNAQIGTEMETQKGKIGM